MEQQELTSMGGLQVQQMLQDWVAEYGKLCLHCLIHGQELSSGFAGVISRKGGWGLQDC